jgi:fumarylacetoacetase
VPIEEAGDHVFGMLLVNDWSARDIQAWEYRPLGPFLGKSFATSVAGWVTPLAALEPFRVDQPHQDPAPLEYLRPREPWGFDLDLEVALQTESMRASAMEPAVIAQTNFRDMYWTAAQQLAHLTVNGASLRTGDLCGSGTISGSEPGSLGSLLELAWNGTRPIHLPDGSERTFLEDGDEVTLRGAGRRGGRHIELGAVKGRIVG